MFHSLSIDPGGKPPSGFQYVCLVIMTGGWCAVWVSPSWDWTGVDHIIDTNNWDYYVTRSSIPVLGTGGGILYIASSASKKKGKKEPCF